MTTGAANPRDSRALAKLLAELFLGRSSATGKLVSRDGEDKTIRGPINAANLTDHVEGRVRIGAVPFTDDEKVGWACIDLDARNWGSEPDDPKVIAIINRILEGLGSLGVRGHLERSRSKGWHIWLFFDEPIPAKNVRAFLLPVALKAGARDEPDLICPRSDRRPDVGNGTWLPLFGGNPHPHTRFYTWDAEGERWVPAADQSELLQELIESPSPASAVPPAPAAGSDEQRDQQTSDGEPIPKGRRNSTLTSLAGTMRRAGMKVQEIYVALCAVNRGRCVPPLLDREVNRIAESIGKYRPKPSGRNPPLPRLLSAEEWRNDVVPEEIVQGLVYRASTHLLTGAAKAGKSWWVFQLLMAVAKGAPFLGLKTKKSKVLLVSLELSAAMVLSRMEGIAQDVGLAMPIFGEEFDVIAPTASEVPELDLGTPMGAMYLTALIDQSGAELVILDTLYRFLPGKDPSSNAEMGEIFGWLNEVAQFTGAALLPVDHVAKGDQSGPTAHSGIGAQVKGGASRVIIGLKRTAKAQGGRWRIDVESHFRSWDRSLFYQRPQRHDRTWGDGCVLCSASRAYGLSEDRIRQLFKRHGERDGQGRRFFASKAKFTDALIKAKHAKGKGDAAEIIQVVEDDYAEPEEASNPSPDRPIMTRRAPRNAVVFTWKTILDQSA